MMGRQEFNGMAHNYADSFERIVRAGSDRAALEILWDNVQGFVGIAKASNPRFDRELFMMSIADILRNDYGKRGLPEFNTLHINRYGYYPYG